MKVLFVFTFLVVIGSYFGTVGVAAQEESSSPISTPLVAISGTDSHVTKPSYERVTTAKDWRRIWAGHLETTVDSYYRAIMEVDFDRCLVVVMFRGEQIQIRQITIDSVLETAGSITIRFNELGYGIGLGKDEKPPKPERPYAFVILPKTNKEIVWEEKIWSKEDSARGRPPKWEERARLKPTQTVSRKP
jgi:hypothetical protein